MGGGRRDCLRVSESTYGKFSGFVEEWLRIAVAGIASSVVVSERMEGVRRDVDRTWPSENIVSAGISQSYA